MQASIYLAKLIGPVMLVAAVGMLVDTASHRAMMQEFLRSTALIYLSGVMAMTVGLAIVLYHNVWVADWPIILTLFGWAGAIGGALRMMLPGATRAVGEMLSSKPWIMTAGGVAWLVLSAVLCFFGYFA
jgi:hypothetical protein